MKVSDVRGFSDRDLIVQLDEAHRDLFNLRIRLSTMQLKNHREVRAVKKNIARINTVIRERELGIS
ncbi:MAG: 50S ribosomal protein L29 [Chloroflexota bacterium]|nr:50S ribosomal protein L29 [Chloroflexota bacterium]